MTLTLKRLSEEEKSLSFDKQQRRGPLPKRESEIAEAPKRPRGRPRKNPQPIELEEKPVLTYEASGDQKWVYHPLWTRAHVPSGETEKNAHGVVFQKSICPFVWALTPQEASLSVKRCEHCLTKLTGKIVWG